MQMRYPGCTGAFWGAPGLWGAAGLGQEEKRPPSPGAARRLLKRPGVKVGSGLQPGKHNTAPRATGHFWSN